MVGRRFKGVIWMQGHADFLLRKREHNVIISNLPSHHFFDFCKQLYLPLSDVLWAVGCQNVPSPSSSDCAAVLNTDLYFFMILGIFFYRSFGRRTQSLIHCSKHT